MAKKRFLVVEDSFIQMRLIRADEKAIVEIETDPEQGGMTPGSNLLEVDDNGNPVVAAAKPAKSKRTAATHNDGTAGAGGEAGAGKGTESAAGSTGGNATDLA